MVVFTESVDHDKMAEAIADINVIRARAGVPALVNTLNQSQVLQAIEKERLTETPRQPLLFSVFKAECAASPFGRANTGCLGMCLVC